MAKYDPIPFTNISKTDFTFVHDTEQYVVKAGEKKYYPQFIVDGMVNYWKGWAVNSSEFGVLNKEGGYDKQAFLNEKWPELEVKLRAEEKIYTCEECGKTFPNQGGLNLHAKAHKKVE